jgi:hypothetical protein
MGSLHSPLALDLASPESPEHIQNVGATAGIRRAIESSASSSQLISECLKEAQTHHLGREEIYVVLAYRGLVELKAKNQLLKRLETRLVEYAISDDPDEHFKVRRPTAGAFPNYQMGKRRNAPLTAPSGQFRTGAYERLNGKCEVIVTHIATIRFPFKLS